MDRDDYIDVDYAELTKAETENFRRRGTFTRDFKKCNITRRGCHPNVGKYDTKSITHYDSKIGSIKPKEVFTPKKPCGSGGCKFGQREGLSDLDISDIEKLYGCGK